MKLEILNGCKTLEKSNHQLKKNVIQAAKRLGKRIVEYSEINQTAFECIFSDDKVKYDKHGDFYTYKGHGNNHSQIRLLYACIQEENTTKIIIVDFCEKRKPPKAKDKDEHINRFNQYNNLPLSSYWKSNKDSLVAC